MLSKHQYFKIHFFFLTLANQTVIPAIPALTTSSPSRPEVWTFDPVIMSVPYMINITDHPLLAVSNRLHKSASTGLETTHERGGQEVDWPQPLHSQG